MRISDWSSDVCSSDLNQMRTTKLAAHCSTSTDRLGRADCAMAPGVSGEVTVVATTTAADGNEARAVRSVWLAGDDDWWFGGDNGARLAVLPEKPRYAAGEWESPRLTPSKQRAPP